MKFRLSLFISLSGCFGFLYANDGPLELEKLIFFILGGFFITVSANSINQIIESGLDALMKRTQARPLPSKRLSNQDALAFTLVCAMLGFLLLISKVNVFAAFLTFVSMLLYGLVYTPLKRITPFSVFVGAVPGALPPLIGYVAVKGHIDFESILLFSIQFIWQFPHFWAIAWILDEDYKKAGFNLLPSSFGKDKHTAFQILVYTIFVLPVSILPFVFGFTGVASAVVIVLMAGAFIGIVIMFFKKPNDAKAKKIMFYSIIYLPVIQLLLYLDKI